MRIAISGATGLIGSHLSTHLKQRGDEIIPLRREFFTPAKRSVL
ncbi:NAD-dependent epimerase/dehydratase family protein, partial [Millionella massiliensis]